MRINGTPVVENSLAIRLVWEVQRHATRKRRRNWRPIQIEKPCILHANGVLYAHPSLMKRLRAASPADGEKQP